MNKILSRAVLFVIGFAAIPCNYMKLFLINATMLSNHYLFYKMIQNMLTFTITLYLSRAIIVMDQMEAQPNSEPNIPYSSHINGPATSLMNQLIFTTTSDNLQYVNLLLTQYPSLIVTVYYHRREHGKHHEEV